MAKKALVWKEDYKHYSKYQIERIGESEVICSLKSNLYSMMHKVDVSTQLEDFDIADLKCVMMPKVAGTEELPEHWSDGSSNVYDINDIPTLINEDGNPYIDPSWYKVAATLETEEVPAYLKIVKRV